MSAWLLLNVYVLVDVLDVVIVLFHSCVFEYILVYSSSWRGGCCAYLQNVFLYAEKTASGGCKRGCERRLGKSTFPLAAFVKYGKMHIYS